MISQTIKDYYDIIEKIELKCFNNITDDKNNLIFTQFQNELQKITSYKITFDSNIIKALIKRLQSQYNLHYYEDSFTKTLDFIKFFQQILIQNKFISKRLNQQLLSSIDRYQNDIQYKYYGNLDYLRTAKKLKDFREDFFYRYCNIDDDQTDQWDSEDYKEHYCEYWNQFIQNKPNKKLIVFIYSCFTKFQDPTEMLTPEIRKQIQFIIGEDIGKTDIQIDLNKMLKSLAIQNMLENSHQTKQRINKEYNLIMSFLNKLAGTKKCNQTKLQLYLAKFGSLVSGFAGNDADLDVTILTNCYLKQINFINYVNDFLKIQFAEQDKKTGQTTKVQYIPGNIPLVQVKITQNRRQQQLKIDIAVNNILGVINSKLLNVYSSVQWIKHLGILIKMWSKKKELIGKNLLSSYAIILLMIHFLIKKNYVNIIYDARNRNINTQFFKYKRIKQEQVQNFKVYFEFESDPQKVTTCKSVSLFAILKEFMYYYSKEGAHWQKNEGKNIISIDGTYDKQFQQNCVFTIKDPFDEPHNPGRASSTNRQFYQNKFLQGYKQLQRLQSTKDKDERQRMLSAFFQK